jgi:hypothetical protein
MDTKKNTPINAKNPLTLYFDLGIEDNFDYIYFVKRAPNTYAPKVLTISTSQDNITWYEEETVTTEVNGELVEINLNKKLHTRYVKLHITETTRPNPGYIALVSVEFIEKNVKYALKNPEFIHILYDTGATNKFATEEELEQIETNKTNISNIQEQVGYAITELQGVL